MAKPISINQITINLAMDKMNRSLFSSMSASFLILFLLLFSSCASTETQSMQRNMEGSMQPSMTDESSHLNILFLGDDGHHQPEQRIHSVMPYFAEHGMHIHYTDRQTDLTLQNLKKYDVFMMYGNRTGLSQEQETALLTYIHEGGGFVAVHSASASFNDSDAFVNLVGGAFKSHGTGTFRTRRLESGHPVFQGVPDFESWDETYVHTKHNPDKTVLSVRVEGNHREPWTWVRTHGNGRVFYTAWGHNDRTWSQDGFRKLLDRGIRWSAGNWALDADFTLPEITYGEGKLPYYPAGEPWGTTGDPI
ncbi:MAG: ThuA domain-containing protein, partial [Balneolaceae bacterium]